MTTYYCIDMPATGAHIRQLRRQRGLSVRDVAKSMGFEEPQAIYKWERGKAFPTVEHLMMLSVLFGVKMEEIPIWNCFPSNEQM